MKIRVIAFDMDDTLIDTTRLLLPIAGTPEYMSVIQRPLVPMGKAIQVLTNLRKGYQLVLITQGNVEVQKQKVKSLGIVDYFSKIYFVNSEIREQKSSAFQQVLKDFQIPGESLLSIGNRRSTDIRFAKELGAKTCLLLYGEHQNEIAENNNDVPDFEIHSIEEVFKKCQL